jgi:hypothetical protein
MTKAIERGTDGGKKAVPGKPKKKKGPVSRVQASQAERRRTDPVTAYKVAVTNRDPLTPQVLPQHENAVRKQLSAGKQDFDLRTEEGLAEFRAAARKNFQIFCTRVAVIQPKSGPKERFKWNRAQRRLAATIIAQLAAGKPMQAVVAKARQWGCSTLITVLISWLMVRTPSYKAAVVLHDKRFAPSFRDKYRMIMQSACRLLGLSITVDNNNRLQLSNGSMVDFYSAGTKATAANVCRSETYQVLHLTEIPYWYDVQTTMTACLQSVELEKGNGVFIESTPRGRGDAFHNLYLNAKLGKTGYAPVFVPWHELDGHSTPLTDMQCEVVRNYLSGALGTNAAAAAEREYGLVPDVEERVRRFGLSPQQYVWWCRKLRDKFNLNISGIKTEFPDDDETCFLTSGQTVLSGEQLQEMGKQVMLERDRWKRGVVVDGRWQECVGGWFEKLSDYDPQAQYLMAADIGQGGTDGDMTVIGVAKLYGGKLHMVAGFAGWCDPSEAADKAKEMWTYYGKPMMAPEANGPGVAFIQACRGIGIYNMWLRQKLNAVEHALETKIGVQTTSATKPAMIAALRTACRQKQLVCGWEPVYGQMSTFCWTDINCVTARAVKGAKDDAAMMTAILCWVAGQLPDQERLQQQTTQRPLDFLRSEPAVADWQSPGITHPAHLPPVSAVPTAPRQSGSVLDFL